MGVVLAIVVVVVGNVVINSMCQRSNSFLIHRCSVSEINNMI